MSPERAGVFVVDDSSLWQAGIKDELEESGHRVLLTAGTFEEALEKTQKLSELGVKVAIVDSNLSLGDWSGRDGRNIVKLIREFAPNVKIIGLSDTGHIKGADKNLDKLDLPGLGKAVSELK